MNPKHEKFAAGLAAGLSGKDAAIRAGFAERSAKVTASRLRRDPCIVAEIDRISRGLPLPFHRRPGQNLDPLEFLQSVMCDPSETTRTRARAAIILLPYTHSKLR